MAVENIDLSQEIESWKSAVYGKDVRSANVAAFEKIQGTVNDTVQNVNQAAEDSASASHNAQAAVDSIQTAITTATEKAAAAATSATQAAGSQAAAASSKTAAAQSETNAAASAAEARQIAEGFGGFDGTAASVKATDTYGLVVDALGESTTQALIDAIANKVMNELVKKSQILNNLLATVPGNALDAVQGKNLQDQITQLNGDLYPTKTTDIIAFADSCGLGLNCFLTGADLSPVISGMSSPYTIGLVLKRGEDAATVMMFAYSKKEVYCLFKNTTWDTIVTKL